MDVADAEGDVLADELDDAAALADSMGASSLSPAAAGYSLLDNVHSMMLLIVINISFFEFGLHFLAPNIEEVF